jgi:hypothetical protein
MNRAKIRACMLGSESSPPPVLDRIDADWPTLDVLTERYCDRVLNHVSQNRTRAAEMLGVDRRTVTRMLARRRTRGGLAGAARPATPRPAPEPKERPAPRPASIGRIDAMIDRLRRGG